MTVSGFDAPYAQFCQQQHDKGLLRALPAYCEPNSGVFDFSHNDYLGLSTHPQLLLASIDYSKRYGTGATGSRLLSGNMPCHEALEQQIAHIKGTDTALVFNSGYQANATVLAALLDSKVLGSEPLVFSDRLNHASLHHACQLAGVKQIRYRHNDLQHLTELLEKHANTTQPKFIVAETVFGMDGDALDMTQLVPLAQRHNAFVYLDEAHATGVVGPNGYGLCSGWMKRDGEHIGIAMGTFSKALGCSGAYIACSHAMKNYLLNKCTGFIFSTAPSPAVIGSVSAALHLLPSLHDERTKLLKTAQAFREFCHTLGLDTGSSTTHIIPILVGQESNALALKQHLLERGCLVSAIRPPTVPPNTSRIRIALSSRHGADAIRQLQSALTRWVEQAV